MCSCFDFSSLPNLLWYYHILTKSLSRKTAAMSKHQLLLSEDENPTTYPIPSPQPCHQSADYSHCCITKASPKKKKKNSKQLKSKRTKKKKLRWSSHRCCWSLSILTEVLFEPCTWVRGWTPFSSTSVYFYCSDLPRTFHVQRWGVSRNPSFCMTRTARQLHSWLGCSRRIQL